MSWLRSSNFLILLFRLIIGPSMTGLRNKSQVITFSFPNENSMTFQQWPLLKPGVHMNVKIRVSNNGLRAVWNHITPYFVIVFGSFSIEFIICVHSIITIFKNRNYGASIKQKKGTKVLKHCSWWKIYIIFTLSFVSWACRLLWIYIRV